MSGLSGVTNKTLDTTLSFNGIGAQKAVTAALQDDSYLSFTFATSDLENPGVLARSPFDEEGRDESAKGSVFGKGYKISFSKLDPNRFSSPNAVMSGINGFDLENNGTSNGETWVCPPSERYIIVRAEDARRRFDGFAATGEPWEPTYDDGGIWWILL